jgi:hypothetical protein
MALTIGTYPMSLLPAMKSVNDRMDHVRSLGDASY